MQEYVPASLGWLASAPTFSSFACGVTVLKALKVTTKGKVTRVRMTSLQSSLFLCCRVCALSSEMVAISSFESGAGGA